MCVCVCVCRESWGCWDRVVRMARRGPRDERVPTESQAPWDTLERRYTHTHTHAEDKVATHTHAYTHSVHTLYYIIGYIMLY